MKLKDKIIENAKKLCDSVQDPFVSAEDDVKILKVVRSWLDDEIRFSTDDYQYESWFNYFWTFLSEALRGRDPYYKDTINLHKLYYIQLYEIGDYATAAYQAINAEKKFDSGGFDKNSDIAKMIRFRRSTVARTKK